MNCMQHEPTIAGRRWLRTILRCGYIVAGFGSVMAPPGRFFIAIHGWIPFWKWSAARPLTAAAEIYCMLVTIVAFTFAELYLPTEARRENWRAMLRNARVTGQLPPKRSTRLWWRFKPAKKDPKKSQ